MHKQYKIDFFAAIFLIVFLGIVPWACFGFVEEDYDELSEVAVEIQAEIVGVDQYYDSDGERQYRAYVRYDYAGVTYEDVYLDVYSSDMCKGRKVTVLCNPYNPYDIKVKNGIPSMTMVFKVFCGIFIVIGIGMIVVPIYRKNRDAKIISSGRKIWGVVENIIKNENYRVNDINPWIIYCTYNDELTGETYYFKSDNLWYDPRPIYNVGDLIPIAIASEDYKKYMVMADETEDGKFVDYT